MHASEFLGLRATHNPMRWVLDVVPGICTDEQFLFGGCGLGAAIEALEQTTGRPAVWAVAQYLSFAHPPEIVDIDVTVARAGHQTTQARAVAHVGDREILTVNAALGERDARYDGQWARFPDVPAPDDSPPRHRISRVDDSLAQRLEMRLARGRDLSALDGARNDGHSALWARLPSGLQVSAASLAILGDYVPFGVAQALGQFVTGSSPTTRCGCARSCRPTGCSSTCGCTPSRAASATDAWSCGPKTAPCSPPRASRASCGRGRRADDTRAVGP
jgi:acyl-CoA thioesterase